MLSKGSILVVDDEVNLCRILGAKLAKSGYSVVAVHDGQQAIDKVRESSFDVVLLDLMLPKVDGLSALAEIRNFNKDLPVIVMTACESSESLDRARSHGVSAYVNKPFDLDNLIELVQSTSAGSVRHEKKQPNGSTGLFGKNRSISIEIINGRTSGVYPTLIESKDDRTLSVIAPVRDGRVIEVAPRTPVRIGLAAADAYYNFNSYVLSFRPSDVPVLVLDKPGVIYRTQRRQSTRVPMALDLRYGKIDEDVDRPQSFAEGKSCDLSTGGIRIIATTPLEPGDMVYLEADRAGSFGPITAVAEVLRSKQCEQESEFMVAMRFKQLKGNLGSSFE